MNVTENVRISIDGSVSTIEKKIVVGENASRGRKASADRVGTIRWDSLGYYGSLDQAARALLTKHPNLLATTPDAETDLKTLLAFIVAAERNLTMVCKKAVAT